MHEVSTIGIDVAKHVFQLHGADGAGEAVISRRLRRGQVAAFFAALPPCVVGIEARGTAHFWAREIARCGHDVRLMPPGYVKPYVKRNSTMRPMPKPSARPCAGPPCASCQSRRQSSRQRSSRTVSAIC